MAIWQLAVDMHTKGLLGTGLSRFFLSRGRSQNCSLGPGSFDNPWIQPRLSKKDFWPVLMFPRSGTDSNPVRLDLLSELFPPSEHTIGARAPDAQASSDPLVLTIFMPW